MTMEIKQGLNEYILPKKIWNLAQNSVLVQMVFDNNGAMK